MKIQIDWPKQGNRLFSDKDCDKEDFHTLSIIPQSRPQVDAFFDAGERLLDTYLMDEDVGHRDHMLLPICFMYRHAIELRLKRLLDWAIDYGYVSWSDKLKKLMWGHGLTPIWAKIKPFMAVMSDENGALTAVESMINELHQIDPNSQVFRYDRNRDGDLHDYAEMPEWISKDNLRSRMKALNNFLAASEDKAYFEQS